MFTDNVIFDASNAISIVTKDVQVSVKDNKVIFEPTTEGKGNSGVIKTSDSRATSVFNFNGRGSMNVNNC